ncbi:MAG TPA: integrase core domain-containing protein [Nitrospira sp.]
MVAVRNRHWNVLPPPASQAGRVHGRRPRPDELWGALTIAGAPVGRELGRYYLREELQQEGSSADRGNGSGREFFAYCFQEKLMEYGIKFRPIRPASPHLNGKVERSQRTDLEEFYPTVDLKSPELAQQLQDWQDHYNQYRPHGALQGRTPWQAWLDKLAVTPFHDEVEANYDASAERIRHPDYRMDLKLAGSKTRNRLS